MGRTHTLPTPSGTKVKTIPESTIGFIAIISPSTLQRWYGSRKPVEKPGRRDSDDLCL